MSVLSLFQYGSLICLLRKSFGLFGVRIMNLSP